MHFTEIIELGPNQDSNSKSGPNQFNYAQKKVNGPNMRKNIYIKIQLIKSPYTYTLHVLMQDLTRT